MRTLLDTHFLLWIVVGSPRLSGFRWLEAYRPWGVSPVSLLEIHDLILEHHAFIPRELRSR